ncbi:hypothetical protein BRE01_62650 [Brevibacillus reuszeri]|uniref:Uncharacterized protein n=1 Tax=Brevibacillus reuszeri TaxID=54915 RepID=A0A0K9YXH4_9BACL|nr:hypothetical protein [Brevibacillus reuszeri]KNB72950.1 hypothetical protein ADS79_14090 [Brevibacillus reuszeri]GED72563.1 hypothetical protein BRE01_62650 [Brevibacillus reuszeri]
MMVPLGAAICLYTGISKRIDSLIFTMNLHNEGTVKVTLKSIQQDFQHIVEAMTFYIEHCTLSSAHLEAQFDPVKEQYHTFLKAHFQEDSI